MFGKSKEKQEIEQKLTSLQMSLSNNYKDQARQDLNDLEELIEKYHGQLKEKDYQKYKELFNQYTLSMIGYHH